MIDTDSGRAKFDLNIDLFERDGNITGGIQYAADLFDHATVEALAARLGQVLAAVAADPSVRVSQVNVLLPHEQQQLAQWNQTARPGPARTLPALFEQQATRTADAPAVNALGGTQLTYAGTARPGKPTSPVPDQPAARGPSVSSRSRSRARAT